MKVAPLVQLAIGNWRLAPRSEHSSTDDVTTPAGRPPGEAMCVVGLARYFARGREDAGVRAGEVGRGMAGCGGKARPRAETAGSAGVPAGVGREGSMPERPRRSWKAGRRRRRGRRAFRVFGGGLVGAKTVRKTAVQVHVHVQVHVFGGADPPRRTAWAEETGLRSAQG